MRAEFNADEGIREGRQKGGRTNVGRPAVTGRLQYVGVPRPDARRQLLDRPLRGSSSVRASTCRCTLVEADARYCTRAARVRAAEFAQVWIDNAGVLERRARAARRRQSEHRQRRFAASTLEAAAILLRLAARRGAARFVRLRELRHAVPDAVGLSCRSQQFDRDAWVVGATYWPDPDIAIKVDYSIVRNQSAVIAGAELVQRRLGMVVLMGNSMHAGWRSRSSIAVGRG